MIEVDNGPLVLGGLILIAFLAPTYLRTLYR